ncbi:MAG: putative spermidine/putrescine transport system permease protein [Clostridia bacterium]|nr:transporter permease subunit [Clostridiales bacterium]MDK2986294.1 putative spermidine/putrescine transport system permease protein [Clostridia bacterium]
MDSKLKPYMLLLPAIIVLLGIFMAGLLSALVQSLGYFPVVGLKKITFEYYLEVFKNQDFLKSLFFSLYISLTSSVAAVIIGVLLAYLIVKSQYKEGIETVLYKLPIIVPHMVAALLIFNILSQSGILPRIFFNLGIIRDQSQFCNLVFDKNGIGIVTTYIWKEIPFVTMVVYTILNNLNKELLEVALNLGAKKWQGFIYVALPLLMPTIGSAFIIIFAFSFGAFEVPYLLGPTYPKALPVLAYTAYTNPDLTNRPYAMVISMILTIVSVILILLYTKFFRLLNDYNR